MIETHPDSTTTAYAIETDHLGTPRLLTDATRAPRWRWTSPPFGEVLPEDDPSGLGAVTFNLRFPGQYYDKETGLHYNWNRYYDPGTGRYVQSDPIGLAGGWNTYGYVGGNPLRYSDPMGLNPALAGSGGAIGSSGLGTGGALAGYPRTTSLPQGTESPFDTPVGGGVPGYSGGPQLQSLPPQLQIWNVWWQIIQNQANNEEEDEYCPPGKDRRSTLRPGPNAGDSIPARGPGRDFTPGERDQVNTIGNGTGCHTCGSTDPGTKTGNWIPDHQPPNAMNPNGGPQRLYPQCINCSRTQGGQVRGASR
ncbi:MAG: hypothetical protein DWQ11_04530 [Proteobacteria bacterium]|nr:MAG: hypothetical protein DWQ11_04530 [Pseudomonadota bacterium]